MEEKNSKTKLSFRLDGCLYIAILIALLTLSVKECKRSNIRLQEEQIHLQQLKDSLNQRQI